jgi:deoxyribodipyrimidine photo-lyase
MLALVKETTAAAVYWNRRYAVAEIAEDKQAKAELTGKGIDAQSFNGSLLREPWEVKTKTGGPYRVYTPFWNALRAMGPGREELAAPQSKAPAGIPAPSLSLKDLGLLPSRPNWAAEFDDIWDPSEAGARKALDAFLRGPSKTYGEDRNRPDLHGTSRLSPHLAVGTIGPLQIWNAVTAAFHAR